VHALLDYYSVTQNASVALGQLGVQQIIETSVNAIQAMTHAPH
jgi:hypothetical protein